MSVYLSDTIAWSLLVIVGVTIITVVIIIHLKIVGNLDSNSDIISFQLFTLNLKIKYQYKKKKKDWIKSKNCDKETYSVP